MSRHFGISRSLLGFGVLLSVAGCLASLVCVSLFPWLMKTSDLSNYEERYFQAPWPRSLLAEEQESRKRLRRFPKSEQQRRLSIQLRRMEFLNSTLLDLTDSQLGRFEAHESFGAPIRIGSWPLVYRAGSPQASGFVLGYFPKSDGFALQRAMLLRGGDEFRFSAPLTREARSVSFTAFPLSTSSIRGALGKYSFSSQFEAKDVRRPKRVSHVVYDDTATQFMLKCVFGEVLLLAGRVTRFEKAGRIPVQLAVDDPLWSSAEASARRSEGSESDRFGEAGLDEPLSRVADPLTAAPSSESHSLSREPLDELRNPVVTDSPSTVALGYNLLLVSVPRLGSFEPSGSQPSAAHEDELGRFLEQSGRFELKSPFSKQSSEQGESDFKADIVYGLFRDVSHTLKAYGYDVNAVLEADTVLPGLLHGLRLEKVDAESWLSPSDAALENANLALEKSLRPAKGLEAIFEKAETHGVRGFHPSDWQSLREHSQVPGRLASLADALPFDDLRVLDGRSPKYLARTVDVFQDWVSQKGQVRFAHYVDLKGKGPESSVPSLQGLLRGLRLKPRHVLNPLLWPSLARQQETRRALNQLLEALRGKRLAHRTVVVVVERREQSARGWPVRVFIPGLQSRQGSATDSLEAVQASSEPMSSRILQWLGAPKIAANEPNEAGDWSDLFRYRLTVKSVSPECPTIRWTGQVAAENLKWNGLRVEGRPESGEFDFYPCSARGPASIEWTQRVPAHEQGRVASGGEDSFWKGRGHGAVFSSSSPWGGRFRMRQDDWANTSFVFLTSAEMRTGPELSLLHFLREAGADRSQSRSSTAESGHGGSSERAHLQNLVLSTRFLDDPYRHLELYQSAQSNDSAGIALFEVVAEPSGPRVGRPDRAGRE